MCYIHQHSPLFPTSQAALLSPSHTPAYSNESNKVTYFSFGKNILMKATKSQFYPRPLKCLAVQLIVLSKHFLDYLPKKKLVQLIYSKK